MTVRETWGNFHSLELSTYQEYFIILITLIPSFPLLPSLSFQCFQNYFSKNCIWPSFVQSVVVYGFYHLSGTLLTASYHSYHVLLLGHLIPFFDTYLGHTLCFSGFLSMLITELELQTNRWFELEKSPSNILFSAFESGKCV